MKPMTPVEMVHYMLNDARSEALRRKREHVRAIARRSEQAHRRMAELAERRKA